MMKESYSKRLNILIHGLPENEESPWEERETTLEVYKNFIKNELLIQDPSEIRIADIHRLPQRPVYTAIKNVSADLLLLSFLRQWINQKFCALQNILKNMTIQTARYSAAAVANILSTTSTLLITFREFSTCKSNN